MIRKNRQAGSQLDQLKQKYEFYYAVRRLQKQVPETTKREAIDALTKAAKEISPSDGRAKITPAAKKDLRSFESASEL